MKTWKLYVNGKEYVVQIDDPDASPVSVTVNGKAFQVTLAEQVTTAVKPAIPSPEIAEEDVAYVPDMASTFVTQAVDTHDEPTPTATTDAPAAAARVIAPMPGKILDITAKIGDVVKVGDMLCNLEAMKMKSPIRSTAAGKIVQITVSEGQSVNYGDVLFVLG